MQFLYLVAGNHIKDICVHFHAVLGSLSLIMSDNCSKLEEISKIGAHRGHCKN